MIKSGKEKVGKRHRRMRKKLYKIRNKKKQKRRVYNHQYILFFKKNNLYCILLLAFSPLIPTAPQNHHIFLQVHESIFFLFVQSLHPLTPTLTSCHLLSIYESLSVLIVDSVCSLDSTWVKSYGICLSLNGLFQLT